MRTPFPRLVPGLSNSFPFDPRRILSREIRSQLPDSVFSEVEPTFSDIEATVGDPAYQTLAALMRLSMQDEQIRLDDRAGMSASLPLQVPFVDQDLIDLLATVPSAMRIKGPTGENILRTVVQPHFPAELIKRRKKAFLTPMAQWLRGPLKPLLLDYMAPERIAAAGIFDAAELGRLVSQHLSGERDHHVPLRYFLMFELWRERWLGES
jgi:asparagine synthase (glutamine-hydrolysing)